LRLASRCVDADGARRRGLRAAQTDDRCASLGHLRVDRRLCHVSASTVPSQTAFSHTTIEKSSSHVSVCPLCPGRTYGAGVPGRRGRHGSQHVRARPVSARRRGRCARESRGCSRGSRGPALPRSTRIPAAIRASPGSACAGVRSRQAGPHPGRGPSSRRSCCARRGSLDSSV
jgi:hypothetical protein